MTTIIARNVVLWVVVRSANDVTFVVAKLQSNGARTHKLGRSVCGLPQLNESLEVCLPTSSTSFEFTRWPCETIGVVASDQTLMIH